MPSKNERLSKWNQTVRFLSENEPVVDVVLDSLPRKTIKIAREKYRKIEKTFERIEKRTLSSGAGFPIDTLLRTMVVDINERLESTRQPNISFDYFSPFCSTKYISNIFPYLAIREEFNHLFHSVDFLDYLTSSDSNNFNLSSLLALPEKKVFHFSTNGDINELHFLTSKGSEFIVSGFSMIRIGGFLHWYILGGEVIDKSNSDLLDHGKVRIESVCEAPTQKMLEEIEHLSESDFMLGSPVPLEGTKNTIRTIIASEMDLRNRKHLSRLCLKEYENGFTQFFEDPEALNALAFEDRDATIRYMQGEINNLQVMWDLADGLFQLPNYFSLRAAVEKKILCRAGKKLVRKKGGKGIRANYKIVSAIEVIDAKLSSPIVKVNLPHYELESKGYWHKLEKNDLGLDRYGNEILGRTWINSAKKWRTNRTKPGPIFVKDCIASAKIRIGEYKEAALEIARKESMEGVSTRENEQGELYIMRCAAMKEEIYKVGFTRGVSEERAKEISAATGVPLALVVVRSWRYQYAASLETEVHMMLSPYRINDAREFFKIKLETLEAIIQSTLTRVK